MPHRNFLALFAIVVSITACGNSSGPEQTGVCLQQHADTDTLDALITQQDIIAHIKDAPEDMKTKYRKHSRSITYSWPSDRTRTMTISGKQHSYPAPNIISLNGVKTYTERDHERAREDDPRKLFQRSNRDMTPEEVAAAQVAISKALEKQGKAPSKASKAILGAATGSKANFEPVAGIGDIAAWDHQAKRLNVLIGETRFRVLVDISGDVKKNQTIAKALANSVLAACADGPQG